MLSRPAIRSMVPMMVGRSPPGLMRMVNTVCVTEESRRAPRITVVDSTAAYDWGAGSGEKVQLDDLESTAGVRGWEAGRSGSGIGAGLDDPVVQPAKTRRHRYRLDLIS